MGFSTLALSFDDIEVGQEWISGGRTITESDIVNFAGLSGDFNPIHIDHEFAKKTAFRKPIAHGLLVFSIASGLSVHNPLMRTLALLNIQDLKFLHPVFIGDTIQLKSQVVDKIPQSRGRRGKVFWRREIFNQNGKVVQEGMMITLVEGRAIVRRSQNGTHEVDDSKEADQPSSSENQATEIANDR